MKERVLIVHNYYRQSGGEDSVVEREARLLRQHGHSVHVYTRSNREIDRIRAARVALHTVWSQQTVHELNALVDDLRPDIVHVHNTVPLISPSVYWVFRKANVPVVQTLHNFRLMCPQAMLLRAGQICEDCVGRVPWRSIVHRCYRGSALQSALLTAMLTIHRAINTYRDCVARYIALNEFCRGKFIQAGLPADRIVVKPHFVDIPAPPQHSDRRGGLFVGRLSAEKGVRLLLEIARSGVAQPIKVIGTGSRIGQLAGAPGIELLGWKSHEDVYAAMRAASYVIAPSISYETFGLVIVEAFANGTPVIASRLGSMAEAISDGHTGLLFEPRDAGDLAAKVAWAEAHPDAMRRMGQAARREYERKYAPNANYAQLKAIYEDAQHAPGYAQYQCS